MAEDKDDGKDKEIIEETAGEIGYIGKIIAAINPDLYAEGLGYKKAEFGKFRDKNGFADLLC